MDRRCAAYKAEHLGCPGSFLVGQAGDTVLPDHDNQALSIDITRWDCQSQKGTLSLGPLLYRGLWNGIHPRIWSHSSPAQLYLLAGPANDHM